LVPLNLWGSLPTNSISFIKFKCGQARMSAPRSPPRNAPYMQTSARNLVVQFSTPDIIHRYTVFLEIQKVIEQRWPMAPPPMSWCLISHHQHHQHQHHQTGSPVKIHRQELHAPLLLGGPEQRISRKSL